MRFVPKDPLAAKRQTAHASNPNNQRMETLRLGGLHCKVSETSRNASLYASIFLKQEARGSGGSILVVSSEDS